MIDSGASRSFVSDNYVSQNGIATRKMKDGGYGLTAVDGSALPDVDSETMPLPLSFGEHYEDITLDVVPMARHTIVLGIPWLRKHNPSIDWRKGVLRFERCSCVTDIQPSQGQRDLEDETREFNEVNTQPNREPTKRASTSTDSDLGKPEPKVRRTGGTNAPPDIPKEYQQWAHLFQEAEGAEALPPHRPWDHKIPLKPEGKIPFGPLYAQSAKELQALDKWLRKLLSKQWIRKSTSPAASPCMFVPKKGTDELRGVIDFRKLNDVTIKNRYPLPNIGESQDRLSGAKWFTKIDLRDAFYGIRMAKGEEWKTAFRTRYGLYEFQVMPMGLTNAPASCQDLVNETLRDLLDITVIAYVDDILIYTKGDLQQHIKDVQEVFKRLATVDFKTAPEKCSFHKQEVEFLGFIISTEGIRIDPAKIKSIQEWPTPENVKDVQAFLGLANYLRKYVKNFSGIGKCLTELTKKDTPFHWTEQRRKAFESIKQSIIQASLHKIFDTNKPIVIETDASDYAIGACLTQEHDGKKHPIAYYSRQMSPAEQNYDIHDKELLAIVAALRHWRVYCEGATGITVLSDHKNLTFFTTTKELTRRQSRWSEQLGQYKFEIRYTPGKDNARADALSRRSDYLQGKQPYSHNILKVNQDGSLSANPQEEFNHVLQVLRDNQEEFPIEHGKYKVPPEKEEQCIRDHHDSPTRGHPGIARTTEQMRRNFAFPSMRSKVAAYIKKCDSCQRNKASRHPKYGNLQLSRPAEGSWKEVTMDFITGLPKSKEQTTKHAYDSILVMVDKLTKYCHFIPCNKTITAPELGHLVLDRLIRYHGLPDTILTDRDKLFTSAYWKTLTGAMGIKHDLSTAFHPETDGQTERSNQTLEAYLRHYVNQMQDNWVSLLPMAQLAINNQISETTKETPFFANFGKNPSLALPTRPHPQAQQAMTQADKVTELIAKRQVDIAFQRSQYMDELQEYLKDNIARTNTKIQQSRHKDRKNGPQLKKGDRVYLLTKNLKTKRPSKKLDHVKVGPFLIADKRGAVNYKLDLPPDAGKIHPVFHISLLEPADGSIPLQTSFGMTSDEDQQHEVDRILDRKGQLYLIRWKGYDNSEDTWEPKSNIANDLLEEYHHQHPAKRRKKLPDGRRRS